MTYRFGSIGGWLSTSVCAVALLATGAAYAQQAKPGEEMGQIIVTAQRRAELSVDVPITLTAVNADQLQRSGATSLGAISQLSPAVRFDAQGGFVEPSIRGVGSAIGGAGVGSNVAIYVDGFYTMDQYASDFDLLNVESVQVLKGPQGTLFGRNSTGGAILVTTSKPSHDPHVTVQASYGSFSAQSYDAYATAGLNDKIAVNIAGQYRRGNGFVTNIVNGDDKVGAYENWSTHVGVKFDPSDSVSLLLRYIHDDVNDPTNELLNAFVSPVTGLPLVLGYYVPGVIVATKPDEIATTQKPAFRYRTDALQFTGELNFNWATLKSYTQYKNAWGHSDYSIDRSSAEFFFIKVPATDKMLTQEFILTSNNKDDRLQWTAGLFYMDNRNTFPNVLGSAAGGPFLLASSTAVTTLSIAGFADATYAITPQFFATVGLRYTHEKLTDTTRLEGPLGGNGGLIVFPDQTHNGVTPRAVLRYKPTQESSIFASFSRGEKAPVANTSGASFVPVKPEKLSAFEAGYKYDDRTFSLDLSSYYYDYKDLQIIVPASNGATAFIINAASSRIWGFEGQVHYAIAQGFDVNVGAAYTNAKYKNFPNSQVYNQCLVPACGLAFGTFPPATTDASGFMMQRAPEFSGNVGVRYTTGLSDGQLALSADVYFTSKFYLDTSQQFPQSGYATLGLRAEWTDPSGHFSFSVRGNNVTDKRYRTQFAPSPLGEGAAWNYPATVTGTIRVKY
jgi:iron complex outermembrane receptor protein